MEKTAHKNCTAAVSELKTSSLSTSQKMKKTTHRHPEAEQLYKNILPFANEQTAWSIAYGLPLTHDASTEQRAIWVRYVIDALEKYFSPDVIKKIRLGCYCNEKEAPAKCNGTGYLCADTELFASECDWLKGLHAMSDNIEEFVAKANAQDPGCGWCIVNGELHIKFFECVCPMLEAVGRLATFTWCYCTAGYIKRLSEAVFSCPVNVEIIQSIRQGHEFCLMKVTRDTHLEHEES